MNQSWVFSVVTDLAHVSRCETLWLPELFNAISPNLQCVSARYEHKTFEKVHVEETCQHGFVNLADVLRFELVYVSENKNIFLFFFFMWKQGKWIIFL